jgi:hypothetical protein
MTSGRWAWRSTIQMMVLKAGVRLGPVGRARVRCDCTRACAKSLCFALTERVDTDQQSRSKIDKQRHRRAIEDGKTAKCLHQERWVPQPRFH